MTLRPRFQYNPARRAVFPGVTTRLGFAGGTRYAGRIRDAATGASVGRPGSYSEKSSAAHRHELLQAREWAAPLEVLPLNRRDRGGPGVGAVVACAAYASRLQPGKSCRGAHDVRQ